jgi:hypothetical protein
LGNLIPFLKTQKEGGQELLQSEIPLPLVGRLLLLVLSLLGIGAAFHVYQEDQRERRPIAEFSRTFTIDQRRPYVQATAEVAAAADMALWVLGRATLDDALMPVRLAGMSIEERQLWLDSVQKLDAQLGAAEDLLLWAIARRPGWAFHRILLGQIHYVRNRRAVSPDLLAKADLWRIPLENGLKAGPGIGSAHVFLAGILLENWDRIPAIPKVRAERTLSIAFKDTHFLRHSLLTTLSLLAPEATMDLVPQNPSSLSVVLDVLKKADDARLYATVYPRWEEASLRARTADLAAAEERARSRDVALLRTACRSWAGNHQLTDFDRAPQRREAGKILDLWPADTPGAWRSDPRAAMIRFFLDGRIDDVPPAALGRALRALSNVPEVVRARVLLESGDRYGFDSIVRGSETVGSLQWTPFFVRLAIVELKAGRMEAAREALAHISPAAQRECDVLLARKALARDGGKSKLQAIEDQLAAAIRVEFSASDFSDAGSLPVCLDPEAGFESIFVRRAPAAPALGVEPRPVFVAFGFDGGRSGTALIEKETEIKVPVEGRGGRRFLEIRRVLGGPVQLISASLTR